MNLICEAASVSMADQQPTSDARAAPAERASNPMSRSDAEAAQPLNLAVSPGTADASAPNEVARAGTADWESGQFVWNAGSIGADDAATGRSAESSELERTVRTLRRLHLFVTRALCMRSHDALRHVLLQHLRLCATVQALEFAELASRASVSELDQLTQQVAHLQGLNGAATDKFNEMAEYGHGMSVFLEVWSPVPTGRFMLMQWQCGAPNLQMCFTVAHTPL